MKPEQQYNAFNSLLKTAGLLLHVVSTIYFASNLNFEI